MPKLLEPRPSIKPDEVRHYLDRGYWGYILDYRKVHGGDDPDPATMRYLVEVSEARRVGPMARFVKALIDLVT